MKMVMIVVSREDANALINALVVAGHSVTVAESKGGKLRQASQSLFIGTEDANLDAVLQVISATCHPDVYLDDQVSDDAPGASSSRTAYVGGAIVFVWPIEQTLRF